MDNTSAWSFVPIAFMFIVGMGFIVTTFVASAYLGPQRKSKVKSETFECGVEQVGNARHAYPIKYFLVAILFVLFDVEVIFMYPWAVNFRELGMRGFVEMLLFMAVFITGFLYIVRKGALKWQ